MIPRPVWVNSSGQIQEFISSFIVGHADATQRSRHGFETGPGSSADRNFFSRATGAIPHDSVLPCYHTHGLAQLRGRVRAEDSFSWQTFARLPGIIHRSACVNSAKLSQIVLRVFGQLMPFLSRKQSARRVAVSSWRGRRDVVQMRSKGIMFWQILQTLCSGAGKQLANFVIRI